MIAGLKAEHVKVDMNTFGKLKEDICYGCAATNCIAEISGVKFDAENICFRHDAIKTSLYFMDRFERAIDDLRKGFFTEYNSDARKIGVAESPFEIVNADYYMGNGIGAKYCLNGKNYTTAYDKRTNRTNTQRSPQRG